MSASTPVGRSKTERLLFRALLIALVCSCLGCLLGLAGAVVGIVAGTQLVLVICSLVVYIALLVTLLGLRFVSFEKVAGFSAIAFTINLTAGLIVASWNLADHFAVFIYLFWFFPLVVFQKLVSNSATWISKFVLFAPLVAIVSLSPRWLHIFPAASSRMLLVVYCLSYGSFALISAAITRKLTYDSAAPSATRIAAAEASLQQIVESSEDAIIGSSIDGVVTSWNRSAERIFEYSAAEAIGNPITMLVPPDYIAEESRLLERLIRGERIQHFDTVRRKKSGHLVPVSLTISPIRDELGNIVGASKIARDITERISFQQQLQQSQKMHAIDQLTGGVAHNFNNLLGVIIGNLDLVEKLVAGDPVVTKRLDTARNAALRGADLTRNLLGFSSAQTLLPEFVDLNDLILNVVAMTQRMLDARVLIVTDLDDSAGQIRVDRAGLESALINVFANARDALSNQGTMTLSTKCQYLDEDCPSVKFGDLAAGRYVSISLSDTGSGMPPEVLKRAFEPFFSTKPTGKGTGLGLSMVYGFAKQCKGDISIHSEAGVGTTVTLLLPLTARAPKPKPHFAQRGLTFETCAQVLIVDDEQELLDVAKLHLTEMGFHVSEAADGPSALRLFQDKLHFELLITDIIMPGGMNGVELARKAQKIDPGLKVIYCSGYPAEALNDLHLSPENGPLLRKPFQRYELDTLVRQVLWNGSDADTHDNGPQKEVN